LFLISVFVKYESISLDRKKKLKQLVREYRGVLLALKEELETYFKSYYRGTLCSADHEVPQSLNSYRLFFQNCARLVAESTNYQREVLSITDQLIKKDKL